MSEETKLGIENVKKVIVLPIEIGNVVGEIVAMPAETPMTVKLTPVLKLYDEIMGILTVDFGQVIPEFKDVDSVESEEILELFKTKFNIPQDNVEAVVEKAFVLLKRNYDVVMADIAFAKEIVALKDSE